MSDPNNILIVGPGRRLVWDVGQCPHCGATLRDDLTSWWAGDQSRESVTVALECPNPECGWFDDAAGGWDERPGEDPEHPWGIVEFVVERTAASVGGR